MMRGDKACDSTETHGAHSWLGTHHDGWFNHAVSWYCPGHVDHETLLIKYIRHVGACEGATFLHEGFRAESDAEFTDLEWAALMALSQP